MAVDGNYGTATGSIPSVGPTGLRVLSSTVPELMASPGIRITVTALDPVTTDGGDIREAFLVHEGLASDEVSAALQWWVRLLGESAARGWPRGPERGRDHSQDLFEVTPFGAGTRRGYILTNEAGYALFIHEPGKPDRLVHEREIQELLDEMLDTITSDLLQSFIRGFGK